jgi:hypothetical protein
MARLLTTRRSEWLPGLGALGVAVGLGALLGFSFADGAWQMGAAGLGLLVLGGLLMPRLSRRRTPPPPVDGRSRLRLVRGGRDYDLAADRSTDNQRYLM